MTSRRLFVARSMSRNGNRAPVAKRRVLMFHSRYRFPGGEEQSFENERRLLSELGYEVLPCVLINAKVAKNPVAATAAIFNLKTLFVVVKLIRQHNPVFIYVNNTWPAWSPSLLLAARLTRTPTMQAIRNYRLVTPSAKLRNDGSCAVCGSRRYFRSCVFKGCYNESIAQSFVVFVMALAMKLIVKGWRDHLFVATSEETKRLVTEHGINPERVRVRPNFTFESPLPKFDGGDDAVYVGRLSPEKGVAALARAWPKDSARVLKIIGEGPDTETIRDICRVKDNVKIEGPVTHQEVVEILAQAGVAVVPSQWAEPFGRVAIEALSVATPVIYTFEGALASIVQDGGVGLSKIDRDEISLALDEIFGPERDAYRERAYKRFIAQYTGTRAMEQMSIMIRELSR